MSSIFSIIKPSLRSLGQIMRETILLAKLRITEWVRETFYICENIYFDLLLSAVSCAALPSLHVPHPGPVLLLHWLTAGALRLLGPALARGGVEHRQEDFLPETSSFPPALLPRLHWGMDIGGASQIKAKLQDGHCERRKLDISTTIAQTSTQSFDLCWWG